MKNNLYKKSFRTIGMLLLASCLIFFGLGSPASAAQVQVTKFDGNGDDAGSFFDNGTQIIYVQVIRGGAVNNPQTSLYYEIDDYVPSYTVNSYGYGVIPNGDFTGNWQTGLSLATDTSHITGGYVYGATGPIKVKWDKLGTVYYPQSSGSGTVEVQYGNTVTHISGFWHYSNAVASGTVLSYPFVNLSISGSAGMGILQQAIVTIEKVR